MPNTTTVSVPISTLPKAVAFARYCQLLARARGDLTDAAAMADHEQYRSTPQVSWAFKAETPIGTLSNQAALAASTLATEVLQLVTATSALGALSPTMRKVPFLVDLPRELSRPSGSWVGESYAKPVGQLAYDKVRVDPFKAAILTVVSAELVRQSGINVELAVRDALVASIASFLDSQFLDPAISLIPGVRPASITSGALSVASSGSTAAAIASDLASMMALLGSWQSPRWVMRPNTMAHAIGALNLSGNAASLYGIPIISSANSPQQIVLTDASQLLLGDDGETSVGLSTSASLQMSSTPSEPAGSPMTSPPEMTSLWQRNLTCFRVERFISWLRARQDSVVYMQVSY